MKEDMQKKEKYYKLLEQIKERKRNYSILEFKPLPHQQKFLDDIAKTKEKEIPVYKWLMFQGGNGSGKTCLALYIVILFALGDMIKEGKLPGLPYIGHKREIFVGTKSSSNLKNTIMSYLLDEYSVIRIPEGCIKKISKDNDVIKTITLVNGTKIKFFTYDQGYERLQGTNGDLYLLDEEPLSKDIFEEALARTRVKKTQLFFAMTPLNGYTPVYEFFYEQKSKIVKDQTCVHLVNSGQNTFANHDWADGLSEDDKKMRIDGMFTPSTGLVYPSFSRYKNTIEYVNPKELGPETKFYGAVDFGIVHPTAFSFIAVDIYGHIYVFDLIYEKGLLIRDLAKKIRKKKEKYCLDFEYIVADSASKRERTELEEYGIKTKPADKWSKGENGMSNRRAGIMKLNQLFHDNKVYINEDLKDAIKELENHHYKTNGKKDGEVEKTQDDFLDSIRYFIFSFKPPKYVPEIERRYRKKYGHSPKDKYLKSNRQI